MEMQLGLDSADSMWMVVGKKKQLRPVIITERGAPFAKLLEAVLTTKFFGAMSMLPMHFW